MPLSGHLSDLSLSELIEFFCNQRKTGQLKVLYPQGHGNFYLQTGSVVDARIGVLRGIEAVYYALTLPNAKFEFSGSDDPMERTINQPWTQVVLEGLRRLDEGVVPANAFPAGYSEVGVEEKPLERMASEPIESNASKPIEDATPEPKWADKSVVEIAETSMPAFLSAQAVEETSKRKVWVAGAVAVAVIVSVAAIGVPAGWYGRKQAVATATTETNPNSTVSTPPASEVPGSEIAAPSDAADQADHSNDPALAAKRQRERDKAKAREERANLNQPGPGSNAPPAANVVADSTRSGPKKVTVTVTYDESGRVTQASGGDASAVRIARQKRFPAGKAGSATITIPIN